ncbi:MAG: hypothetical protein ACREID_05750 [Planctomycetota bacterium]
MSNMAKIFVVANLVLALAIFGAAAAFLGAQDDYKAALVDTTKKADETVKSLNAQIAGHIKEIDEQKRAASLAVAAKTQAESESETLRTQLADAKAANDKLTVTGEGHAQNLAAMTKILEEDRAARATLQKSAEDATQNSLSFQKKWEEEVANRAQMESQIANLTEQVQSLSAEKGDLEKSLRDAQFLLDSYKEKFGPIGPQQGADGVVLAVKENLVTISVGANDKVRVGDEYHIRRGERYVGRITIRQVMKNMAVGNFDGEFKTDAAPPQMNDVAYTRR